MSEEWIWIGNDGERLSASTIEELEKKVGMFKTVLLQEKKNETK